MDSFDRYAYKITLEDLDAYDEEHLGDFSVSSGWWAEFTITMNRWDPNSQSVDETVDALWNDGLALVDRAGGDIEGWQNAYFPSVFQDKAREALSSLTGTFSFTAHMNRAAVSDAYTIKLLKEADEIAKPYDEAITKIQSLGTPHDSKQVMSFGMSCISQVLQEREEALTKLWQRRKILKTS